MARIGCFVHSSAVTIPGACEHIHTIIIKYFNIRNVSHTRAIELMPLSLRNRKKKQENKWIHSIPFDISSIEPIDKIVNAIMTEAFQLTMVFICDIFKPHTGKQIRKAKYIRSFAGNHYGGGFLSMKKESEDRQFTSPVFFEVAIGEGADVQ